MNQIQGQTYINNGISQGAANQKNTIQITSDGTTNLSSKQQAFLQQLKPGQIFRGEITDISNGTVTIRSGEQMIQARFSEAVDVCMGDVLNFVVKENQDSRILITPVFDTALSSEDIALYRALDMAGLSSSDRNIDVVSELLKNQMPVDKETILGILEKSYMFSNTSISDLVLMTKYELPITEQSIAQFQQYKSGENQITVPIQSMLEELPNAIVQSQTQSEQAALLSILRDTQGKGSLSLSLLLSKDSIEQLKQLFSQAEIKFDVSDTVKDMLTKLISSLQQETANPALQQILKSDFFSSVIKEELLNQWTLSKEELNGEQINRAFDTMLKQMSNITEQFQEQTQTKEKMLEHAQQIKDSILFMKELDENFIYTQLPLHLKENLTQGELYVFANKKNPASIKDGIRLVLHLDMEHLGSLTIFIQMKEKKIDITFTTPTKEVKQLFNQSMESFQHIMEQKGYFITTKVEQEEETKVDFVEDFLKQGETTLELKRYSFDMRA